jgi:tight adherence protein B
MRRLAVALVAAAGLCLVPPVAAADTGVRLTPVGKPGFPERSFALTLPAGRSVEPDRIRVEENGDRVAGAGVSPASRAGRDFAVVLVIDASRSMAGRPIEDAMVAARSFARRRNASQPLGVVTFNSGTQTVLRLTTDSGEIERVLDAAPPLRRQTHLYDGVDAAVSMLTSAKVASGSVVVLTDGSDTGSRAGLAEAAGRARARGVRLFTVGLRSTAFEPDGLRQLAEGTRGRYSEASDTADLARIYDRLGAELSSEYLVQYRSLQGPRRRVEVRVSVEGVGSATAVYRSPAVHVQVAPPYDRNDFWGSPLALVVVSLAGGGLAAMALLALLARPGRRRLAERMALFVSAPAGREQEERQRRTALGARALRAAERGLERMRWWPGFKEELDIARVSISAARVAALTATGALFVSWLLLFASGSAPVALLAFVAAPLAVRAVVKRRVSAQRKLFAEQLADNLQVIASAQRAGHSFTGALAVSVEEAPEPTKSEFERVIADERLGIPMEDGLSVVARRMDSRDLEQVILVARLQRETGGNTAEVLDRVADTVRERGELRRLISSLTAQGRMSRWIVTALPLLLLAMISVLNPEYMKPLFETSPGKVALALAGLLLVLGSHAIKRIVTIKV